MGGSARMLPLGYFSTGIMWLFRIFTQLEVSMNDVERVDEYTDGLEPEAYGDGGTHETSAAQH